MDVIGMTNLQEAKLAREAELCYVTLAMVTDYDCWHPHHDSVTVDQIVAVLVKNAENAAKVVRETVAAMPQRPILQVRFGAGARDPDRSQEDSGSDEEEVETDHRKVPESEMSIVVVGSVAFDDITSPSGSREGHSGRGSDLFFARGQLFHPGARGRRGGRGLWPGARERSEETWRGYARNRARSRKDISLGWIVCRESQRGQDHVHRSECIREIQPADPEGV